MSDATTDDTFDIRRLPFPEALRWLRENGEVPETRPDVDTASLRRRFPRLEGVTVTDLVVASPHGPQPARTYRDDTATPTGRALVWVHGGAFMGGYLDMPESNWVALELAARGIPVFAVDYTKCLGDVHYPVPSDDVLAAWSHAREHSQELLGVASNALLLGGASAGGTLTAGAVARLRDAGADVPAGLVSVYPAAHPDGGRPGEIPDPTSPMTQIALNYAGSAENLANPHVFAGLGSGAGFPPTLVVVCEHDGLRPSGEAFAALLADAGVDVRVHLEPGADHAHINEPSDPTAVPTIDAIGEWIGGPLADAVPDHNNTERETRMRADDQPDQLRRQNRAVVEAFFASNLDRPEERIALWHSEGIKELPFAPAGLPKTRWEGRDEIVANTVGNSGMFADCVHRDLEIHPAEDPELFFVTSRMVPEATFLGEPYPQSFIHVIRVRDGKVILQQEYFNSEILADAERTARAKGRSPVGPTS